MTDDGSGEDRPDESTRLPEADAPPVTPSGLPTVDAGARSPADRQHDRRRALRRVMHGATSTLKRSSARNSPERPGDVSITVTEW